MSTVVFDSAKDKIGMRPAVYRIREESRWTVPGRDRFLYRLGPNATALPGRWAVDIAASVYLFDDHASACRMAHRIAARTTTDVDTAELQRRAW